MPGKSWNLTRPLRILFVFILVFMPFFFKFSILLLKIKMLFSCNSSLRCYTSSFLILLLIWENHAGFLELFTTTGGRRGICTMFCIGRVVLLDLVFSTLNVLISLSNTLLLILLITWQFKTLKRLWDTKLFLLTPIERFAFLFNRNLGLFEMLVFIIRIIWVLSNIWLMSNYLKKFILIANGWLLILYDRV